MNDRSQAGSVIEENKLEFMQSRRIPYDDARGMGEWLNEVSDNNNTGIRVVATYYIDVAYPQQKGGESKQRIV